MKYFSDDEHIENNCTLCKYFRSFAEDYFDDEYEPIDVGFCLKDQNDNYGDATITYDLFENCKKV